MAYYSSKGVTIKEGAAGVGAFGMSLGTYFSGEASSIHAYKEGSLGAYEQAAAGIGYPLFVDGAEVDRPMSIYHGPPPRMSMSMRGLGQVNSNTLDLTDPATVTEVKSALAFAMPEVTLQPAGVETYDERWYTDPVWGPASTELYEAFVAKMLALPNSPYSESDLAVTASGGTYPTVAGVMAILAQGVGSPGYQTSDPEYFPKNFPILHAFSQKVVAAGGDTSKFSMVAPSFTEAERVRGKGFLGMGVGTMAIIGLGAVAAVGAYLVLSKKK